MLYQAVNLSGRNNSNPEDWKSSQIPEFVDLLCSSQNVYHTIVKMGSKNLKQQQRRGYAQWCENISVPLWSSPWSFPTVSVILPLIFFFFLACVGRNLCLVDGVYTFAFSLNMTLIFSSFFFPPRKLFKGSRIHSAPNSHPPAHQFL